ncbi:hypothetical protein JOF56_003206 [Kibdelosporangium banguiense]|uniref:HEAT repeat domain-containing protein n=1 Tax=Kibdelosporangium banguiense TaxID=1365924 RepID=A0ABS4TEN4_9PSEU|nr:DUF6000 family protein [Kibdelosporangium banguiense]MBP2322821.1 hypothetical protein [Kibdelosporangium banguiense]
MSEVERRELLLRYVHVNGRYRKLLSESFLDVDADWRMAFGSELMSDAREISDVELEELLADDWRAFLTACWLIGFMRRDRFRDVLHCRILVGDENKVAKGIFFALSRFGDPDDALVIKAYLERLLPDLEWRGYQPWALGALLAIDERLATNHAMEIIETDGPWDRWAMAGVIDSVDPNYWRDRVRRWDQFANMFDS